jgi:BirA family biotin operon repressor/biotin-[acetyl-CoA-carboxylase] ligase
MNATLPCHWPSEDLWQAVFPLLPGFTVEVLAQVDSTNAELMRRARAGQNSPTLLIAEHQSAGRGRLGRVWSSEDEAGAAGLTFSLGLPLQPRDWSGLSLAVGLSLAHSLHPSVGLKWPNDLWLNERKLGGILIETAAVAGAAPRQVVIGVGLNLRSPHLAGLSTPAVGLDTLEPQADAQAVLRRLALPLVQALLAFERHGFAPLQATFAARDVLHGRAVQLSDGTQGVALGVDVDGALRLQTPTGVQRVTSAEVSVRPATQTPVAQEP